MNATRKWVPIALLAALVFALSACDGKDAVSNGGVTPAAASPTASAAAATVSASAAEAAPSASAGAETTRLTGTIQESSGLKVLYGLEEDNRLVVYRDGEQETVVLQANLAQEQDPAAMLQQISLEDCDDDGYSDLILPLSQGGQVIFSWNPELNAFDSQPLAPTGVWMTLGAWPTEPRLVLKRGEIGERANASYTWLSSDGHDFVLSRLEPGTEPTEQAVRKKTADLEGVKSSVVSVQADEELSARLSYPAFRVSFPMENSGVSYLAQDVYVLTDTADLRIHVLTPAESDAGDTTTVEDWFQSLVVVDTAALLDADGRGDVLAGGMGITFDTTGLETVTEGSEYLLDSMVSFRLQQGAATDFSEDAVRAFVEGQQGAVTDFSCKQDDNLSAKLSYPVWLAAYTTGSNEDTRRCVDAVVQTDSATYCLHSATPIDYEEDYAQQVTERLQTLALAQ